MELWYTELHTPNVGIKLKVKETLFTSRSEYQTIEVLDTFEYGRVLLLDGFIMTTERDEYIYHEMIVHPAMYLHPNPKDVLIIGGGDGGAVREAVKHKSVERVVLCEIDGLVIETCIKFFPSIASELKGNSRVSVVVDDGIKYIDRHLSAFDVLIVDSTDPRGPAVGLFKTDFYKKCLTALKPDGILVAQSESPFYDMNIIKEMHKNLREAGFPIVNFYVGFIPTYPSGMWSWGMASKKYDPLKDFNTERFKTHKIPTRYFTQRLCLASFALPSFMKEAISSF
ncbi:MAG: polyamine aminopropyltransferase [Dissulfurimicrobium sp.]|uniref:polyamine aminopropyltransferase n=1 Tax=Dissulfurimicrobium sp. TaxID=2022436 RepID=UPI00404B1EAD